MGVEKNPKHPLRSRSSHNALHFLSQCARHPAPTLSLSHSQPHHSMDATMTKCQLLASWERTDTKTRHLTYKMLQTAAHCRACCSIVSVLTHCLHVVTHGDVKMLSLFVSFSWTSPRHHCYTTYCEESSSNGGIITGRSRSPHFCYIMFSIAYLCWDLFSNVSLNMMQRPRESCLFSYWTFPLSSRTIAWDVRGILYTSKRECPNVWNLLTPSPTLITYDRTIFLNIASHHLHYIFLA